MRLVKIKGYIIIAFLLLLTTTLTHSQDDVMRVYSKDGAVYAINTAQVDSVTFTFDCEANCSGLECMNMPRPDDSYNYPVPVVWSEQIPTETLQSMSTQAVIQALWEYSPFILTIHRFYYQADFEMTLSQNNAYNELIKRGDSGAALLERLRLMGLLPFSEEQLHQALELVMSQEVFLSQLTNKEKCRLIEIALMKSEWRKSCKCNYHPYIVWLLVGRTLASANYIPFMEEVEKNTELKDFLFLREYLYHPLTLNLCCTESMKFVTEFIFDCAGKYIKEIKN